MKSILYFVFAIMSFAASAQTNIDGIGVLRIGYTSDSIFQTLNDSKVRYKDIRDDLHGKIMYLGNLDCSFVKGYMVYDYKISSVIISSLYIEFYKDSLYLVKIETPSRELIDAIDIVYGKPILTREEKDVNCTYTYTGANVTYKEQTFTSTYRDDDAINCVKTVAKWYDSNCKEHYRHEFELYSPKTHYRVIKCSLDSRDEIRKKENQEKIDKYKDFK